MDALSGGHVRKVLLVGNGSVGKSSLIARFVDASFNRVYKQTIGLDFFEKTVELREGVHVKLQVWDIGGQNAGSKMLPKYVFGSHIVVLCYDTTDKKSFLDLEDWLVLLQPHLSANAKLFLMGNKIDLAHLRQVSKMEHDRFLRQKKNFSGGYLVSAQDGERVLRSFYQMAADSVNLRLSEYELSLLTDCVLSVTVPQADDIEGEEEREDAEAAQRIKQQMLRKAAKSRKTSCTIQ